MDCTIVYNQPGDNAGADELDVLDQVGLFADSLTKLGVTVKKAGITVNFMDEVEKISAAKPSFIINLVESIDNKGELSFFIPALLSLKRIPYSGCPVEAIFITGNKRVASDMMKRAGIAVPLSIRPSEADMIKPEGRYIIKPVWEDGSLGITASSVFFGSEKESAIKPIHDDNHWTIEEFIEGREFNISIIDGEEGPMVLPAAEIVFRNFSAEMPKIVDFKAKWESDSFEYHNTVRVFPDDLSAEMQSAISKVAIDCWNLFGLKGYARVDMRLDSEKRPRVLEVNANPCISPDSGFVAACRVAGLNDMEIVKRIISKLNR